MIALPVRWVIAGKLAVAPAPADADDVRAWVREGVRAVLSMLNESDLPATWSGVEEVLNLMKEAGLRVFHYPVLSGRAPPVDVLVRMVRWMDEMISAGNPVLIVCRRGWGRGGPVIASYMIYKGATPEDAVRFVERLIEESGEEPMTEEQRELPFKAYRKLREE